VRSLSQNLDQATQQTVELTALAEAGDWDAFNDLEQKRQTIVAEINTAEIDESDTQKIRQQLQQLIELNDQLERVCLAERDSAMTQLRSMQQGVKVTKAYADK